MSEKETELVSVERQRMFAAALWLRLGTVVAIAASVELRQTLPLWMRDWILYVSLPLLLYNLAALKWLNVLEHLLTRYPLLLVDLLVAMALLAIGGGWRSSYFVGSIRVSPRFFYCKISRTCGVHAIPPCSFDFSIEVTVEFRFQETSTGDQTPFGSFSLVYDGGHGEVTRGTYPFNYLSVNWRGLWQRGYNLVMNPEMLMNSRLAGSVDIIKDEWDKPGASDLLADFENGAHLSESSITPVYIEQVAEKLLEGRQEFYRGVGEEFGDKSSRLGREANILSAKKAALASMVTLGLPQSVEKNNFLRGLLVGNQGLYDRTSLQKIFDDPTPRIKTQTMTSCPTAGRLVRALIR